MNAFSALVPDLGAAIVGVASELLLLGSIVPLNWLTDRRLFERVRQLEALFKLAQHSLLKIFFKFERLSMAVIANESGKTSS